MGRIVDTLQAGQEKSYPLPGNYLQVIKSSELLEVELIKRSSQLESHILKQGAGLYRKDFDSVVVTNTGSSPVDILMISGVGDYWPSQSDSVVKIDTTEASVPVTLDESQLSLQVNQQTVGAALNGLSKVTIAAGTSEQLAPANALRKYLRINVLSSADVEFILIGGVDANTGGALERGMVGFEETRAAVSAFNPGAVPVDVYLLEVTDV